MIMLKILKEEENYYQDIIKSLLTKFVVSSYLQKI